MAKGWALAGKTLADFRDQIDYRENTLCGRLELIRNTLGEKPILFDGEILEEEVTLKTSVPDWNNRDRDYFEETRMKNMNQYHDFFPEYFSSTPKFTMDRAVKVLNELEMKRREIEQKSDEIEKYKQDKKQYKKLIAKGYDVDEPEKPNVPKITAKELRQEQSIIRLKELLDKESNLTLTNADIEELRALKKYWMYNGDREKSQVIKNEYDYSDLETNIRNLKQVEARSDEEEQTLEELKELIWLVQRNDLSYKQSERLEELSKAHAKMKPVHVDSNYARDNTVFLNYTPLVGTANEVNMKQVVSNLKPLSEKDHVCKTLETMGSYLIRQAEKEEKERANKNKDKNYENQIPTLDARDIRKNDQREIASGVDRSELGEAPISKKNQVKLTRFEVKNKHRDFVIKAEYPRNQHESKFPKFLNIDRSVSRAEIENEMGKGLVDYGEILNRLKVMLETGQYIGQLKRIDHKTKYKIQRWIGDLKVNESELYKSQHRFIDFKKLEKGFAEVTLEDNTGYYDGDGAYHEISQNKFEFGKKEHIAGLIKVYPDIRSYEERVESELYHIMLVLRKFIRLAGKCDLLNKHEIDILKWHMYENLPAVAGKNEPKLHDKTNKPQCKTIQQMLKEVYGLDWDQSQISRAMNHTIPEKIVEVYQAHKEVWANTFRIRGKYKKCNGCGKNKLALKKYFTLDKKSKDGFGTCRTCKNKK